MKLYSPILLGLLLLLQSTLIQAQILNPSFFEVENGLPVHWELTALPGNQASIVNDSANGSIFELQTISVPEGTKPWDMRLVQRNVQIEANREYVLRTTARVVGAPTGIIRVAVFDENMNSLGDTGEVQINEHFEGVELLFNRQERPASNLSQDLAYKNVYVYVMLGYPQNLGSAIQVAAISESARYNNVSLQNPSFTSVKLDGTAMGWEATTPAGGSSRVLRASSGHSQQSSYLMTWVGSVDANTRPWDTRVIQRGVKPLQQGMRYRLSFIAWSAEGSASLRVAVFTPAMVSMFDSQVFSVNTSPRRMSFEFTGSTSSEAILYFMYGYAQNSGVAIDDVRIESLSSERNGVENSRFDSAGSDGRATRWALTAPVAEGRVITESSSSSTPNQVYAMTLNNAGSISNPWAVRLVQQYINLSPENYELSFRVRTEGGTGQFRAAVFDSVLTALVDSQAISVNENWQTMTLPFTVNAAANVMPYFMYGYEENRGRAIFIDDVSIQSENLFLNGNFSKWDQHNRPLYWDLSSAGSVTLAISYEDNAIALSVVDADESQLPSYELNQSFISGFNEGYRLTYEVRGSTASGTLDIGLYDSWEFQQLRSTGITSQWTEHTIEFTPSAMGWDLYSGHLRLSFNSVQPRAGDTVSLRNLRLVRLSD